MNSIEVQNLARKFQNFAVNDLSFCVPQGCVTGFIGENGAGKTTTFKLLLNLIRRDSGAIKIWGLDNITDESRIKENIGVVFDECSFHETLTPRQIGSVMQRLYPTWDAAFYNSLLNRFSILQTQKLKELSRGMKRKLSIAVALSHRPKLLLLDEATSGLDPVARAEILDLFFAFIQDEEHSILMSTHLTTDLEKIADYIIFIHNGSILLSGRTDDILEHHGVLKCAEADLNRIDPSLICGVRRNAFGVEALIRDRASLKHIGPNAIINNATLDDIMLFHVLSSQTLPSA